MTCNYFLSVIGNNHFITAYGIKVYLHNMDGT